jgi:hypothetical protein
VVSKHSDAKPDIHRRWFSIELDGLPPHGTSFSFTLTFRGSKDEPWKWINEQSSTTDGQIIYRSSDAPGDDLNYYIDDLNSYLQVSKETSETPDTVLWSATCPVNAAHGDARGHQNTKLGKPKDFGRWFALVRLWTPWLAPRQGRYTFEPDKEAILAGFQRIDGLHLVVLALSGVEDVLTTLTHDGAGSIVVDSHNDSEKVGTARLFIAVGHSIESAIAATMYHARRLVMKYEVASGEAAAEEKALMDDFKPEWLENWYDGLAYCTWNGIGQKLEEKKIFEALDSLEKNNINISNLIIDDNWQSLNHEGGDQFENAMVEFEATEVGFPRGLKAAVSDIRSKHKNIKHIAVCEQRSWPTCMWNVH